MIELTNISKVYNKKIVALNNINFEFSNNGFYFISGKSGSGKSTLLNIIAKLEKATTGEIKYLANVNIGMVFQSDNLINDFTVLENLVLVSDDINKINELLIRFNMTDKKDIKAKYLSGGEKQRIAIIRNIISGCNVLLFDEATANLDEDIAIEILDLIKDLAKEKLIIFVSHNYSLLSKYADVIIELEKGKIVNVNNIAESKNNTNDFKVVERKVFNIKLILKYSLKLLMSKKITNILYIIVLTIMLTAISIAAQFVFYNDTSTIIKDLDNNNYIYLPVKSTNSERNILKGNDLANNINVVRKSIPYIEVYNNSISHFIYIVDDPNVDINGTKDKLVISSFLAKYYFDNEDPIGKKIKVSLSNTASIMGEVELEVSGTFEVNFTEDDFLNNSKLENDFLNNNYNDINLYYGTSYANKNYLNEILFSNGIKVGGNFILGDLGLSLHDYLSSGINIYKDSKFNLSLNNYNDVIVGSQYNYLLNSKVDIKDLKSYPNYNNYNDYLNFYDLTNEINIVDTKDDINGIIVSSALYNDIINNYFNYLISGIAIYNDNLSATAINELKANNITFNIDKYLIVYHFTDNITNSFGTSIIGITLILLILTISFILFSSLNLYSKKEKEILILKALNTSKIRIITPFLIMNGLIYIISFVISIPCAHFILRYLNDFLLHSDIFTLLYLKVSVLIVSFIIGLIFILIAVITPFIRIMKKEINIGLKSA